MCVPMWVYAACVLRMYMHLRVYMCDTCTVHVCGVSIVCMSMHMYACVCVCV